MVHSIKRIQSCKTLTLKGHGAPPDYLQSLTNCYISISDMANIGVDLKWEAEIIGKIDLEIAYKIEGDVRCGIITGCELTVEPIDTTTKDDVTTQDSLINMITAKPIDMTTQDSSIEEFKRVLGDVKDVKNSNGPKQLKLDL